MDTIQSIKDFLNKSSSFYSELVERKRRDMQIYSR